jgi:hypothetical protein
MLLVDCKKARWMVLVFYAGEAMATVTAKATATADPYWMTNKKGKRKCNCEGNSDGERGFRWMLVDGFHAAGHEVHE